MPTFHNQTKQRLSWDMGGRKFSCEPWGSVELPENLVVHCRKRGIPLDVVPVAPEMRAHVRMQDEIDAARADDIKALQRQVKTAQASEAFAKEELNRVQLQSDKVGARCRELEAECARLEAELESCKADKRAADELIEETAKQATDAEEKALRKIRAHEAAERDAKAECERLRSVAGKSEKEREAMAKEIESLKSELQLVKAEKNAADVLVAEAARATVDAEEKAADKKRK